MTTVERPITLESNTSAVGAVWSDLRDRCDELRAGRSRIARGSPSKDMPLEVQLDAAIVRRLTTEAFEVMAKGLNPGRLNDYLAGLRSKVYRGGMTPTEHLLALFQRVLSRERSELTNDLLEALAAIPVDTAAPSVLHELGTAYYQSVRDDPTIPVETAAWMAALQREDIAAQFRDFRAALDGSVGGHLELLFSSWGRRLSEPYTWDQLGLALSCIIEGMARRALVDEAAVPEDLPARMCVALAMSVTEAIPNEG